MNTLETLDKVISEDMIGANKSEESVIKQITLLSSATIVVIGTFLSTQNRHITQTYRIFLLLAVIGMGLAMFMGVVHFYSEQYFWRKRWQKGVDLFKTAANIGNEATRAKVIAASDYYSTSVSSRLPYYFAVTFFAIGSIGLIGSTLSTVFSIK